MKKFMMISMIFSAVLLVTPAWSHHPAEGIVSDEIWQMVDDLLDEADSPHLDIDFDDVMGSVSVEEDPETGGMDLVSSILVPTEYSEEYLDAIEVVIDDMGESSRVMDSASSDAGDRSTNQNAIVSFADSVVPVDLGDGTTEIFLFEPIGSSSMTVPSDVPAATGKGSQ